MLPDKAKCNKTFAFFLSQKSQYLRGAPLKEKAASKTVSKRGCPTAWGGYQFGNEQGE
jgi:hypothetical protein